MTEHLTGRQVELVILPMSYAEYNTKVKLKEVILYGAYPQIIKSKEDKQVLLKNFYNNYIIEFLKVDNADGFQKLVGFVAH